MIDGYSRRIMYLHLADNNWYVRSLGSCVNTCACTHSRTPRRALCRSETVFDCFEAAVAEAGWPSRTRADLGGENILVKEAMEEHYGPDRRSHLEGASAHNSKIERLWVLITHWPRAPLNY